MMRRGFTIIELLVASLLLGMLVMILTMIFNQSSIAWRTGMSGTAAMDDARQGVAEIVEESDNAFVYNNKRYRLLSPWDDKDSSSLRTRACNVGDEASYNLKRLTAIPTTVQSKPPTLSSQVDSIGSSKKHKNYIVNVMSDGPDRVQNTSDDIWSSPNDFDE